LCRAPKLLPQIDKSATRAGLQLIPSEARPVTRDNLLARAIIAVQSRRLQAAPPGQVNAHPSAAAFPGSVPKDAARITLDIPIQTAAGDWGWFGTGLYAAPGEVITVQVPRSALDKGLAIVIGSHTDELWRLDSWKRMPAISIQSPVRQVRTEAANAFGGLIYLSVPRKSGVGDFVATIAGGVPAPRYVLGKTDLTEWRNSIRNRPAPWAEIESRKIVLTVPSSLIRGLNDPDALMQTWDRISDLECDFAGHPHERERAERLVPDLQIEGEEEGGALHAGYPITSHMPSGTVMVDREALLKGEIGGANTPKGWGLYHELGHNVQNPDWLFEGNVEGSVNLFTLYVFENLCGTPVASNVRGSKEYRLRQMTRFNFAKPDFDKWKNDPLLGMTTYEQLQQAFGWDAFKKVFAEYLRLPESERPRTDAEKRDQWVIRLSRQVQRNLGPFFQAWGFPVSARALAELRDLPVWISDELPKS